MPPSHYDPRFHHRRSIRLRGYDYSQAGAYFVTIVTHGRACLFGEIVDGEMTLNRLGQIVRWEWLDLPKRFPYLDLGAFVVMPNHFHAILIFRASRICARTGDPPGQIDVHSADVPLQTGGLVGQDGSSLRFNADTRTGDPSGQIEIQSADGFLQTTDLVCLEGSPLRSPGRDAMPRGPQPGSLGAIMAQFKSRVTKRLWKIPSLNGKSIWQRNYYEHIIRNEDEMARIWRYIESNPYRWTGDRENPHRRRGGG
jgi:REP element-mobilizing transposase RayT